jgi:hypothetical protein
MQRGPLSAVTGHFLTWQLHARNTTRMAGDGSRIDCSLYSRSHVCLLAATPPCASRVGAFEVGACDPTLHTFNTISIIYLRTLARRQVRNSAATSRSSSTSSAGTACNSTGGETAAAPGCWRLYILFHYSCLGEIKNRTTAMLDINVKARANINTPVDKEANRKRKAQNGAVLD